VSEGNQNLNKGQTLFPEKAPDLFTDRYIQAGGLPPCLLKSSHCIPQFGQSERGDTFARKISGGKISKIGIYPEITIKKFLNFFSN
jgi:hypothetical protein